MQAVTGVRDGAVAESERREERTLPHGGLSCHLAALLTKGLSCFNIILIHDYFKILCVLLLQPKAVS